jgi:hypothetical protein
VLLNIHVQSEMFMVIKISIASSLFVDLNFKLFYAVLKNIWSLFTQSGSLWVAWIHRHLIKDIC